MGGGQDKEGGQGKGGGEGGLFNIQCNLKHALQEQLQDTDFQVYWATPQDTCTCMN